MAMDGGVVQYIKLLLDRGSVAETVSDASAAGKQLGDAVAAPMNAAGTKGATNYGDGFKGALLRAFDRIRDSINGGLADAEKAAGESGTKAGQSYSNNFMSGIKKLAGMLGVALGARAMFNFGKESVDAFAKMQSALNLTNGLLANTGIRFSNVRGEVEKLQQSMERMVGPTQFYDVFNKLLLVTKDYKKALLGVPVVLDLVASAHIDPERAARLFGRALDGDVGALTRITGKLDKHKTALEQLTVISGQAQAKQQGMAGTLQGVDSAWEAFQITLGQALSQMGGGAETGNTLAGVIHNLTSFVRENASGFGVLADVVRGFFRMLVAFGDTFKTVLAGGQIAVELLHGGFDGLKSAVLTFESGTLQALGTLFKYMGDGLKPLSDKILSEARRLDKERNSIDDAAAARFKARVAEIKAQRDELGPIQLINRNVTHPPLDIPTPPNKGNPDTKLTHEIELLGKGLLLSDQRVQSAAKLDAIEAGLNAKLQNRNLTLEQRVRIEDHIKEIAKARETPDTALRTEITSLKERLTLTVADAEARKRLVAIQTDLTARAAAATKNSLAYYAALKMLTEVTGALAKDTITPLQEQARLLHEMAAYPETRNKGWRSAR